MLSELFDCNYPSNMALGTAISLCCQLVQHFDPDLIISTEFGTDIHSPQRMKQNDFDDPLTFYQASPPGSHEKYQSRPEGLAHHFVHIFVVPRE